VATGRRRKTITMVPPLTPKGNPPVNTSIPVITGSLLLGQILTTTLGSWTNNPVQYYIQWQRDSQDIPGAVFSSYTVQNADLGHSIQSVITAWNVDGPGYAKSIAISGSGGGGLGFLSFSTSTFTTGSPSSGTILGATLGSTITATGLPSGLTINGPARTYAWDGTGSVSSGSFTLTETLAPYAPVNNNISYVISAPITYDTTIGNGVDVNGFTTLPLRVGANRYYVKNGGSDLNAGTNPAFPLATLAHAVSLVTQSNGDQVLLAEGSTFSETLPYIGTATKDGFSALYPTVISSYDPADPNNEAKIGMGHQRSARPILTGVGTGFSNQGPNFVVIKGLDFNPGNVANSGMSAQCDFTAGHGVTYFLFENNICRFTGLTLSMGDQSAGGITGSNIVIRNNSFYGMWANSTSAHTGGLYIQGASGITVEDNIFWHCGWNTMIARNETDTTLGTPTVFNHSYYIQTNTTSVNIRRNLSADGSGDGGIARGDVVMTENMFIDNPAAIGLGGGPNYNTERPTGVNLQCSYNAIIGSDGVDNNTDLVSWGINTTNGLPDSRIHHNLMVRAKATSGLNNSGFSNNASFALPSYTEYEFNLIYNWVAQSEQLHSYFLQTDANASFVHSIYDYNNWDGTAQGTNTNNGLTTFPNAYTASSLYTALGYADKNAFITYAINHPEAHIQRTARTFLFTGYGISAPVDITAPTLTSPTATATGSSTATIGATTNEANGVLWYIVTTSNVTPHWSQIKLGIDNTGTAAAFSGSQAVSSTGAKTATASGLISATTYFTYLMHEDASGNKSTVSAASSFTTTSTAATWNGSTDTPASSSDWVRSNGNLTANRTVTTAGFWAMLFASSAKTNGTFITTVNSIAGSGLMPCAIGISLSAETQFPGHDLNGDSIGYINNGSIEQGGGVLTTVASYTAGDVIKVTKSGVNVSFYKNNVLQVTIDTSNPANGFGTVLSGAAYPVVSTGNAAGTQVTADFTSW
jgi:hypothetical protein